MQKTSLNKEFSIRDDGQPGGSDKSTVISVTSNTDGYSGMHWRLYLVASLALLSAINYGNALSLGPIIEARFIVDFDWNKPQTFYYGMCLFLILGHIAGASLVKSLCQHFGPKRSTLLATVSSLLGWLLIFSNSLTINLILSMRVFNAFSASISAVCTLVYLTDISTPELRGTVLVNFTTGFLFGIYFPMLCSIGHPYLYVLSSLVLHMIAVCVLFLLPESPVYLLANSTDPQQMIEAEKSLHQLRPPANPCATLFEINRLLGEKDKSASIQLDHVLFYRPLQLSLPLALLQECTLTTHHILLGQPLPYLFEYFLPKQEQQKESPLLELYWKDSLLMAVVQLIVALAVVNVAVKWLERRTILVAHAITLALTNLVQAILINFCDSLHTRVKQHSVFEDKSVIPEDRSAVPFYLLDLSIFLAGALSTTIRAMVWLVILELSTHEYRAYIAACSFICSWMIVYLVTLYLYVWPGLAYVLYYLCTVIALIIGAALYFWMPNTKDMTVSEIISQNLAS